MTVENNRVGQTIRLGDPVRVRVLSVDLNRRFINFALEEHAEVRGLNNAGLAREDEERSRKKTSKKGTAKKKKSSPKKRNGEKRKKRR